MEEIVHPFRESVFINGFEPTLSKDAINIEGRHWRQKIIIRYVSSTILYRLFVFAWVVVLYTALTFSWKKTLRDIKKNEV